MNADQGVRAGSDLMLSTVDQVYNYVTVKDSPASQQALRTSAKNILYVVVNSRAYAEENLNPGMAIWEKILLAATIAVGALLALWQIMLIKNYGKRKKGAK
jgi:beta-glucosidase